MKITFLSLCFLISFSLKAQYRNFSVGVFGQMSHVPCKNYFSSPGAKIQYNFKKVFSASVSYNRESMKFNTPSYDDVTFKYYQISEKAQYDLLTLSGRASFGKSVLFFIEAGFSLSISSKLYTQSLLLPDFPQMTNPQLAESKVDPINGFNPFIPIGALGLNIPIYKNIRCELMVSRSFYTYSQNTVFGNGILYSGTYQHSVETKRPFTSFKFGLSLIYQFNFSKKSSYSFTTYYPKIKKNRNHEKAD